MNNIIEIHNLFFSYEKENEILKGLSLDIQENSINAILGANGCGKSTLLDCLVGVHEIKEGQILIKGKSIKEFSDRELAKQVAYISQSTSINIDYSIRDFILFGRSPYQKIGESPKEDDYKKCDFYANKMGISYLLDKSITKVSGGERQLSFICRALIQESPILIFDEPMAALDFGNQSKLLLIFEELKKEGKTVIFTTHNPNQVIDLNCNVLVVDEGKILVHGLAKEVISKELLEKIYKGNFGITENHFTYSK